MEAEQFGSFIQSCRKELGLTQAELAEQIHVTDKAISRWERGIGFPDIKLLEPLAEALGITLIELMQSRRIEEELNKDTASALAADTVSKMQEQQKLSLQRRLLLVFGTLAILAAEMFILHVSLFMTWEPRWMRQVLHGIGYIGGIVGVRALRYIVTKQYLIPTKKTIWHTWQMWGMSAIALAGFLLFTNSLWLNRGTPYPQIIAMLVGCIMMLSAALYYAKHEFDFDHEEDS